MEKLFYTWLAISVANCHVLFTQFYKEKLELKKFQEEIIIGRLKDENAYQNRPDNNLMNDHYPVKMMTGPKRCKVCYFNSTTSSCAKSSYRCFKCSLEFNKDISLCVLCFGNFHSDREKYFQKKKDQ